jgi:hypothetical protein
MSVTIIRAGVKTYVARLELEFQYCIVFVTLSLFYDVKCINFSEGRFFSGKLAAKSCREMETLCHQHETREGLEDDPEDMPQ